MGRISGVTKGLIGANRRPRGNPHIMGNGKKWSKNQGSLAENSVFGLPRPSPVQPRSRFSIWGKSENSEKNPDPTRPKSLNILGHFSHHGWIWCLPEDPARKKLLGDALGSRFGAMRVQISPRNMFLEGPDASL